MPETNTGTTIGTPGAGVTVNTESPNMRFGYSGLDLTLRKRAVKDEVLIDKRTGEMLYKRKEDGKGRLCKKKTKQGRRQNYRNPADCERSGCT